MEKQYSSPEPIHALIRLHRLLKLEEPKNALVSIIPLDQVYANRSLVERPFVQDFYSITIRKSFKDKVRYSEYNYHDNGVMVCIGLGRDVRIDKRIIPEMEGYVLAIDPDFFKKYHLVEKIKNYEFFSYNSSPALHLTEEEEGVVIAILKSVEKEILNDVEHNKNELIASYIDLLLNYCNRFYKRQFTIQKYVNTDILTKLEALLNNYFESKSLEEEGLPSVQYISDYFHLTPNYLSDLLRAYTGKNASQHIQDKAIDKAKELLCITNLSISEISYKLGFEYPQSFNKFFKRKTRISPQKYRLSIRDHFSTGYRKAM